MLSKKQGTLVMTFGRFQPPTTGHLRIVNAMEHEAAVHNANACILFPSPTHDSPRNPLPFRDKVELLRKLFPRITISQNERFTGPIATLFWMCHGFEHVVFVCGEDQARNYQGLVKRYKHYGNVKVVVVPRDAISGTALRELAAKDDYETFRQRVPTQNSFLQKRIFNAVKRGLNGQRKRISTVRNGAQRRPDAPAGNGARRSNARSAVRP